MEIIIIILTVRFFYKYKTKYQTWSDYCVVTVVHVKVGRLHEVVGGVPMLVVGGHGARVEVVHLVVNIYVNPVIVHDALD